VIATSFAAVAILAAGALRSSGRQGPSAPPAAQAVEAGEAAQLPALPPKVVAVEVAAPRRAAPPAAAPPPVEPKAATTPVPVPAPAVAARAPGVPSDAERTEIWSLLDSGRLDESASRIKRLVAKNPDAAWPRFALGVLDYRKYWRRESINQWRLALAQDPEIRQDPQFGAYLCFMLDDAWTAAGVTGLLNQLGAQALPLLDQCVASAKTPRLRALASRARDRIKSP
jgi:hypothetical protein